MTYGRPIKYNEEFIDAFYGEWHQTPLSLRCFCRHKQVPYVSIRKAYKRIVDKNPHLGLKYSQGKIGASHGLLHRTRSTRETSMGLHPKEGRLVGV